MIAILSLCVALLAVFFGPLVQLWIAKKQIKANVLSANRQEWIHILREQIAEYSSSIFNVVHHLDNNTAKGKEWDDLLARITFHETKIELLLNPTKPLQKKIIDLIAESPKHIKEHNTNEINNYLKKIVDASQILFQSVWQRVKNIE